MSESLPRIDVLVAFTDADRHELARVRAEVEGQEGVDARLVLLDLTSGGDLDVSDHRHLRWTTPSVSRARRRALRNVSAEFVAWHSPAAAMLPGRLRRALDALRERPGARLATCDYYLTGPQGGLIDRSSPACMGELPGPGWEHGVLVRRAAAETAVDLDFFPSELDLYRRLRDEQGVAHVQEPGFTLPLALYRHGWDGAREAGARLVRAAGPSPATTITVHLTAESGGARELAACLEGLARQNLPAGRFDVQLAAGAGSAEEREWIERLALPFALRRCSGANPFAEATGDLVFLARTDAVLGPDCLRAHAEAHERVEGGAVVFGPEREPRGSERTALGEWMQGWRDPLARAPRAALSVRVGNVSARRRDLEDLGGLAPGSGPLGAVDLGLRLEASGRALVFEPSAETLRAPVRGLASVRARVESLARWTDACLARHPDLRPAVADLLPRASSLEPEERRDLERALEELGRLDLEAIHGLGPAYEETVTDVRAHLRESMPRLVEHWWAASERDESAAVDVPAAARSEPAGVDAPAPECAGGRELPCAEARVRARTPGLSVIVPTHDRPEALVQLLQRLGEQDLPADQFEVIVVDDGSQRPASELFDAARADHALTFLRQSPAGPGVARNLGLERARGRYVVFFNDDAVPGRECLSRHLHAQLGRGDGAAVLGSFTLLAKHRRDSFAEHVETSLALFAQPRMKAGVLYDGQSFCSGNISIARESLVRVGGFDESFPYAGGEDSELGLRLERELGTRVVYEPLAHCGHDHALDVRGFAARRHVVGWAAYRIEQKHGGTGLVPLAPADEAAWENLRQGVLESRAEMERLIEHAQTACRCERDASMGPRSLPKLRPVFEQVATWGQHVGFLLAREGSRPDAASLERWFEAQAAAAVGPPQG